MPDNFSIKNIHENIVKFMEKRIDKYIIANITPKDKEKID